MAQTFGSPTTPSTTQTTGIDYTKYAGQTPQQLYGSNPNGLPPGWDWNAFDKANGTNFNSPASLPGYQRDFSINGGGDPNTIFHNGVAQTASAPPPGNSPPGTYQPPNAPAAPTPQPPPNNLTPGFFGYDPYNGFPGGPKSALGTESAQYGPGVFTGADGVPRTSDGAVLQTYLADHPDAKAMQAPANSGVSTPNIVAPKMMDVGGQLPPGMVAPQMMTSSTPFSMPQSQPAYDWGQLFSQLFSQSQQGNPASSASYTPGDMGMMQGFYGYDPYGTYGGGSSFGGYNQNAMMNAIVSALMNQGGGY